MSEFLDSIKITDEDKKRAITKMLFTVIHEPRIMSLEETLQILNRKFDEREEQQLVIEQKLSQNEILATYSLAKELKISIITSSNKELREYLELTIGTVNEEKLLKFINEAIRDIELTKRRTPKLEWNLQIGKILRRLEGKGPYNEEEMTKQWKEDSNRNCKIIKLSDYLEK